jgi:hypothetical protein
MSFLIVAFGHHLCDPVSSRRCATRALQVRSFYGFIFSPAPQQHHCRFCSRSQRRKPGPLWGAPLVRLRRWTRVAISARGRLRRRGRAAGPHRCMASHDPVHQRERFPVREHLLRPRIRGLALKTWLHFYPLTLDIAPRFSVATKERNFRSMNTARPLNLLHVSGARNLPSYRAAGGSARTSGGCTARCALARSKRP